MRMNEMKLSALALLLGLFTPSLASAAAAPVERVVVFADRAMVVRKQTVTCKGGNAVAKFGELVPHLDARTLRATASGSAKALGVAHRITALEADADERVAKLKAEIQAIDDAVQVHQQEISRLQSRATTNLQYANYFRVVFAEALRGTAADTRTWASVLDGFKQEELDGAMRRVELGRKIREQQRQRDLLQRRLNHFQARQAPEALEATVAVDCGKEAKPVVRLAYVVGGASWRPEYDLRFTAAGGKTLGKGQAELTVGAVVTQSSGEDWEDAQVVLSTAKPRLGARAPMPAILWVDGYEVGKERVLVQATEKRDQLQAGGPAGSAGPASAELADKGQSVILTIPRKVTVRADGSPYWFPVDRIEAAASSALKAVPKLSPFVYQVARLKNPASYPLLAGTVHTYRGGSYVGDTDLEYRGAGEPIEVSLGLDERLRLERIDVRERDKSPGFLGSTRKLERIYRVEIESQAKEALPVEIHERIPVSKEEAIQVILDAKKTTAGYELDEHRGFINWTPTVKPGKKASVELHYEIKLPEDWKVSG
ncbi:MAG: mucoidy inhibitor MuiA family protein [Deltaproteobacteria bacterium]|nr:mucoidy inhibitor MuiA family protein [Deltaproteobacteria bacterium]